MLEFQSDMDKDAGETCFCCFFKCYGVFHMEIISHGVILLGAFIYVLFNYL